MMKYDLLFDGIRNEENFRDLLDIVETKHLEEHRKVEKWLLSLEEGLI